MDITHKGCLNVKFFFNQLHQNESNVAFLHGLDIQTRVVQLCPEKCRIVSRHRKTSVDSPLFSCHDICFNSEPNGGRDFSKSCELRRDLHSVTPAPILLFGFMTDPLPVTFTTHASSRSARRFKKLRGKQKEFWYVAFLAQMCTMIEDQTSVHNFVKFHFSEQSDDQHFCRRQSNLIECQESTGPFISQRNFCAISNWKRFCQPVNQSKKTHTQQQQNKCKCSCEVYIHAPNLLFRTSLELPCTLLCRPILCTFFMEFWRKICKSTNCALSTEIKTLI